MNMRLPFTTIRRLCKKAGAERVSAKAVDELSKVLVEFGTEIVKEALTSVMCNERKTLMRDDVKIAAHILFFSKHRQTPPFRVDPDELFNRKR